jgi:transcriptional regulator with XRE-family HTH domain
MLSQEEMARELGVSFATVNRWETGKAKPTYRTLRLIDEFCKKRGIAFNVTQANPKTDGGYING